MKRLLLSLLLAALAAACGGGDQGDPDGLTELDSVSDAEYETGGGDCESPTDVGVLVERVPRLGWPDLEWEDPHPGGWETIDVTTAGVEPSGGDIATPLQELIDGLSGPTILEFPAGTYELHSAIDMAADLIIRGAGPDATHIELVDTVQAFSWTGTGGQWSWGWIDEEYQPRTVLEDVPIGGNTITLDSTADLAPGDIVMVAETLDNPSFPSAALGRGGIFALSEVTADTVTLGLPLMIGLHAVNGHGDESVVAKVEPIANGGIQDLHIASPTLDGYGMEGVVDMYLADNVFIRNVVSTWSFGADVRISNSRRVLVTDCFFDRTQGSAPDGGESIWVDQLVTRVVIVNNILREKHPPLMAQVGGNFVVYAYNFHVDRLADYCHETADPNCRDLDWIRDETLNGIARGWHGLADVVFHGNFPHHYLIEGNVFYNAILDYHHYENGPGITIFRNRILGSPHNLTWWMNGYGIWIDGPHHGQNLVGNVMLNDSIITFDLHNGPSPAEDVFVAANELSGAIEWGDLAEGTELPPSLYTGCPPSFWPDELEWPPFGPDVTGAAANPIPAGLRYEEIEADWP